MAERLGSRLWTMCLGKANLKMASLRGKCYLNAFWGPPFQRWESNTLCTQQVPMEGWKTGRRTEVPVPWTCICQLLLSTSEKLCFQLTRTTYPGNLGTWDKNPLGRPLGKMNWTSYRFQDSRASGDVLDNTTQLFSLGKISWKPALGKVTTNYC